MALGVEDGQQPLWIKGLQARLDPRRRGIYLRYENVAAEGFAPDFGSVVRPKPL